MSELNHRFHIISNLDRVLTPEKQKSFSYLSKFFEVPNLEKLDTPLEELLILEEKFHYFILYPERFTRIGFLKNYVSWIAKLCSKTDIRYFLVLENFTKCSPTEKDSYNDDGFLQLWIDYMDIVSDPFEVAKLMKKNEICTSKSCFWNALAFFSEKQHDFISANQIYLEGFEKNLVDEEKLQKYYKEFEVRMTKRIEREIRSSSYSMVKLNEFIQKELRSKYEAINKERINSHKKREINFISNNTTYLDEKFRNFVIPRCTKLVEEYTYLQKFLLLNDIDFMSKEESYLLTLSIQNYKKPVSWVNDLRDSPDSYNISIKSAKSVGKFSV